MSQKFNDYINVMDYDKPILSIEMTKLFPYLSKENVRLILKRLNDRGVIQRASRGIYFKPNPNRLFEKAVLSNQTIIEDKYIKNNENIIGYRSGIGFANEIGLTTQTASVDLIISNIVSNKKRIVKINNRRIVVNSPRIEVTNQNYKLLQILDLLLDFDNLSEYKLIDAKKKILDYVCNLKMEITKIIDCVDAYPRKAQISFYKSGILNDLTQ